RDVVDVADLIVRAKLRSRRTGFILRVRRDGNKDEGQNPKESFMHGQFLQDLQDFQDERMRAMTLSACCPLLAMFVSGPRKLAMSGLSSSSSSRHFFALSRIASSCCLISSTLEAAAFPLLAA